MLLNSKSRKILTIIFLVVIFCTFQKTIAIPETDKSLVPFIGMKVRYRLNLLVQDPLLGNVPFPIIANWTVTWEKYNATTPNLLISNLTVESSYMPIVTGGSKRESGVIIENITSRQVIFVDLTNATFLQILDELYYSSTKPNYTPFYINTTSLKINDTINIYSFKMSIITNDRILITDFGYRDVWVIQVNVTNLENIEHAINLVYDDITGILVGGNLYTRRFWDDGSIQRTYQVKIICQQTNALTRLSMIIKTNEFLAIVVCCIPIFPLLIRILRMKEIEGGL